MIRVSGVLVAAALAAQPGPDLSGVWRYNRAASRTNGPGPPSLVVGIELDGSVVIQRLLASDAEGREQRAQFRFDTAGQETTNRFSGVPIRSRARWEERVLVVESSFHTSNPPMEMNLYERWTLSPGGDTLTVDRRTRRGEREQTETVVFDRGSPEDLAALNRPEKPAGENFKNIQVLRSLPSSQLMETMNGFQEALGVKCDHCHVVPAWEKDDKPPKLIARKMWNMTAAINRDHLGRGAAITCNTCHRGRTKPE